MFQVKSVFYFKYHHFTYINLKWFSLKDWILANFKIPDMMRPLSPEKDNIDHKVTTLEPGELQAILNQQFDAGVCLLSESPFRILRVSSRYI